MSPDQECDVISSCEERQSSNEQDQRRGLGGPDWTASCLVGILKVMSTTVSKRGGVLFLLVAKLVYADIQAFCLSMVLYEIYVGTVKFVSEPVASTGYSTESELPMVSLCQYRTVASLSNHLSNVSLLLYVCLNDHSSKHFMSIAIDQR